MQPHYIIVYNSMIPLPLYSSQFTSWHSLYKFRAVAAGPVSPVSTGTLFPHLWVACLALPISALLSRHPRNALKHKGTMLKLAKWLQTV